MYDVLSTKPVLNKVSLSMSHCIRSFKLERCLCLNHFIDLPPHSWLYTRHWCKCQGENWSRLSATARTPACRGNASAPGQLVNVCVMETSRHRSEGVAFNCLHSDQIPWASLSWHVQISFVNSYFLTWMDSCASSTVNKKMFILLECLRVCSNVPEKCFTDSIKSSHSPFCASSFFFFFFPPSRWH